jgi:hypothetical protein
MKIHELVWPPDRLAHIERHGVTPEEVEEACFGGAFVQRAKSRGKIRCIMSWDKLGRGGICSVL